MDLTNITTITKSSVATQNFDLRYSKKSDRFQVSDSFYASKDLNNVGFKFHLAEGGKTPLISLHDNEDAVFFKGKENSDQKNPVFSYNIMTNTLKDLGLITEENHTNFDLELVGEQDGVPYYKIVPHTEEEETEEVQEIVDEEETEEADVAVEDEAEAQDDLVAAEEEDEDPFA